MKSGPIVKIDEQIVDAVVSGRRKGQDLMVGQYGQEVFGMVVRLVGDVMDAEELTQDTFLRAFRSIGSYDPRRASLGTWLCRIAYRLTLDFMKRRRPLTISIEDTEVWQTDISDERMLLTLHYFENRPLDECSFIMDATPHALANRLYRIRKKLYNQLQKI